MKLWSNPLCINACVPQPPISSALYYWSRHFRAVLSSFSVRLCRALTFPWSSRLRARGNAFEEAALSQSLESGRTDCLNRFSNVCQLSFETRDVGLYGQEPLAQHTVCRNVTRGAMPMFSQQEFQARSIYLSSNRSSSNMGKAEASDQNHKKRILVATSIINVATRICRIS